MKEENDNATGLQAESARSHEHSNRTDLYWHRTRTKWLAAAVLSSATLASPSPVLADFRQRERFDAHPEAIDHGRILIAVTYDRGDQTALWSFVVKKAILRDDHNTSDPSTRTARTCVHESSSTAPASMEPAAVIERHLEEVLRLVADAYAEDEKDVVGDELTRYFQAHGCSGVEVMHVYLMAGKANEDAAFDLLRGLGRVEHSKTHKARRWILTRALGFRSSKLREGALLGIAAMDDPLSTAPLRLAWSKETHHRLRRFMQQVLMQLEETAASCRA